MCFILLLKSFFKYLNKLIVSISDVYCLKSDTKDILFYWCLQNKITFHFYLVKNSDISDHKILFHESINRY